MSNNARKQNYWVLKAMGFTNTETLLYCPEHRRITLTWEGEAFCCLKAKLEAKLEAMQKLAVHYAEGWSRLTDAEIEADISEALAIQEKQCSQCGQPITASACGPTHAALAAQEEDSG